MNPEEEDSAKEWERIKDFVGSAKRSPKHPLIQEAERQKAKEPQHFDDGGPVQPEIPEIVPDNTPPSAPPAPTQPPMDAGSGAATTAAMGGVTPEMLKALADKLNTQNKWGQVGAGVAGIGDAIQSVGGIKGGHMEAAENLIQRNRENQLKTPEMMMAAGKEQYGLGKQIGEDDPNSEWSKTAQFTYGPDLMKLGLSKEEVQKMPRSLIGDLMSKKVSLEEARGRIAMEEAQLNATTGLRKDAQGNQKENDRVQRIAEITQQLAKLGITGRNVTDRDQAKALQAELDKLQGGGAGGGEFDHGSIPPGTKYQAPDGTWRVKK